jgi:uncharacterized protein (TIGR02145 family)
VTYSIDGTNKSSLASGPYEFDWETGDEELGSHSILATSKDNDGGTASDEITVKLIESPYPAADFTADQNRGEAPLTVQFTDQSTKDPTSWLWDFGDGSTSDAQNPNHVYNEVGLYSVSLTAENGEGSGKETKKYFIKVIEVVVDARDNQTYEAVGIGTQTWFAENLNYEMPDSWWYDNDPANGELLGRLYTWDAAVIACPGGWHLPTDEEWMKLEMFLGMSPDELEISGDERGTDQGQRLKSTTGWNEPIPGTDEVGFAALAAGERSTQGTPRFKGTVGTWWTASEIVEASLYRALWADETGVRRGTSPRGYGFSVRCIKN